ncbi:MAG TPA: DUF1648 domain-containing protein [Planktothrix sp.]|jgi:uncharacterized membrane protein
MKPVEQPRPKLPLPLTKLEIVLEVLTVPIVLFNFALLAVYSKSLPATVPTHFDLAGTPNGWSSAGTLWGLATFGLFNYAALTVVARFPHTFNYIWPITEQNAPKQYVLARKFLSILKMETSVLMFVALWNCVQVAIGAAKSADTTSLFSLVVMVLVTCLVYAFGAYWLR